MKCLSHHNHGHQYCYCHYMKTITGIWIDHRKAVIASASASEETTQEILSNVEKKEGLLETEDHRQREYDGHIKQFYDRVIAAIPSSETLLIFGPGEAKGEFKKQIENSKHDMPVVMVEAADKMTTAQIMAKVRSHVTKQ